MAASPASYRLLIEYEGTRYGGWQEQTSARTVAGELRRAAQDFSGAPVELAGSGRTDAGVHALAQVATLRLRAAREPAALHTALNQRLPADIHVLRLEPCAPSFDPRKSAVRRSYLYQIATRRTAFLKRFVWWVPEPLDLERMHQAAQRLLGRHDFRHYCERPKEQHSTIVVVEQAELARIDELVLVRLVASHFLWKMVRRLTGLLVEIGRGRMPAEQALAGLQPGGPPPPPGHGAPPSGLFLERVVYPGSAPLGPIRPALPLTQPPWP